MGLVGVLGNPVLLSLLPWRCGALESRQPPWGRGLHWSQLLLLPVGKPVFVLVRRFAVFAHMDDDRRRQRSREPSRVVVRKVRRQKVLEAQLESLSSSKASPAG